MTFQPEADSPLAMRVIESLLVKHWVDRSGAVPMPERVIREAKRAYRRGATIDAAVEEGQDMIRSLLYHPSNLVTA